MTEQSNYGVSSNAFASMRDVDVDSFGSLSDWEIRPLMPSLVRMALCMTLDTSPDWVEKKKRILQKLSSTETANSIVSLLSVDFHALDTDVKKEAILRQKMGSMPGDSILVSSLTDGLALEFERSEGMRKLRLVLSELFAIHSACRVPDLQQSSSVALLQSNTNNGLRPSELFDNEVYLDEVSDVLCIAVAELPNSLLLTDLAETLLYVRNGGYFICRLVANAPESFHEVCTSLINNGDKQDEETSNGRIRMRALRLLCQMNPEKALVVRTIAVDNSRMPGLAVMVTLDHVNPAAEDQNDIVPFTSGIIMGSDDKTKTWFSQYIRIGQKKIEQGQPTTLTNLRNELQNRLSKLISDGVIDDLNTSDSTLVKVCSLLRLYCALRGVAAMKFTDEESMLILKVLTSSPPATMAGIKLVSISICMLLSCSALISATDAERKAVSWIQKLVREEKYFGTNVKIKSSLGELLLLIAIHFHSNSIHSISELVCGTLQVKLPMRQNNLARMKIIFTQEIFTEEMVTTHSVKVPVTPNLSSNVAGFLPVHCVYQLLKSRAFSKHKVAIRDWIFKQICNTAAPLHPVLPALIETFVSSILIPDSKSHLQLAPRNEPIEEEDLVRIFKRKIFSDEEEQASTMDSDDLPTCLLTSQLLLLHYVLLYEDVRLSHTKSNNATKVKKYSPEFMSQIPIFYLVQEARKDLQKYGVLFPILLRLIATNYPHLCLVQDWLDSQTVLNATRSALSGSVGADKVNKVALLEAFKGPASDQSSRVRILNHALKLSNSKLWAIAPTFVDLFPGLLEPDTSLQVLDKVHKVWWRLNSIFPDCLWVMTVNAVRVKENWIGKKSLTWDDIVLDPLHVLRCDERVFRNKTIMKITLHMLSAFLAASRTFFGHHLLEKTSKNPEEEKNREELRDALIRAQEGAAIQILLECCIPTGEEEDNEELLPPLKEVQQIFCTNLHQMFIIDKTLAKLVHFQTYDSRLLKLTVESVPSMHICLDFIPELLSQPDLSKQVFAIDLCSHLSVQYSTPKFLSAAKLCFNVSSTLLSILSGNKRNDFFSPVLPALVRMCQAFPPLLEDANALLNQLESICISKLAATSTTFISSKAAIQKYSFDRFKHMSPRSLRKFQQSLSADDCLFFTIQKSFAELTDIKKPIVSSNNV